MHMKRKNLWISKGKKLYNLKRKIRKLKQIMTFWIIENIDKILQPLSFTHFSDLNRILYPILYINMG